MSGANAAVLTFGDVDCLGFGCYGANDPTSGATLQGLAAGAISQASGSFIHGFPFTPDASDFPATDQIFVGTTQTGAHDGYSVAAGRLAGPQIVVLDYSSLIPAGQTLTTLTLGIAADDFQFPAFGQAFSAAENGTADPTLTAALNTADLGGPLVHFFSIGLPVSLDTPTHTLTLSINETGDGGDGWAVDFLTVGVTTQATSAVPEPTPLVLMLAPTLLWCRRYLAKPAS